MGPTRIKSWFNTLRSKSDDDIETKVVHAQNGDQLVREQLIRQYQPFVKKTLSKACRRYISESMDEFSIGLMAFNEAIDKFDNKQGSKFLTFATVVIKRRIIDFIRKESKHNHILLAEEEDEEGNSQENYLEQKMSIDSFNAEVESRSRVEEIKEYQRLLSDYDITFKVLTTQCPKHYDARENAKQIAKLVADNIEIRSYLKEKKRLPIKEIELLVSSSRKTIERNRKYIIAMALIYIGEFHALRSYIEPEEGGE
ncbi:RNA polymerase sigma-I factor [Bacillus sp. Marseille-P3661]|uniref:RNA polymerase sigma-I factor n=1 Tax=Bacillus sp. Marseille-P3661 TaxID=1936234 RepID=UPI000C8453A3|nr:RNA polymerase sigma-I factor [Bacillus sp. Marseille-P3661]